MYNFDWTLWTGFPLPTVTWSREDAPLPQRAIVNEAFLIIQSIRPEDAGTYVCTVENTGGRVTRKVTLFVRGITQYQKRKWYLKKNNVVTFSHRSENHVFIFCYINFEVFWSNLWFILILTAKPVITGGTESLTAALGSSASMSCQAAGYPQPQISWYKRGGSMPR